MWKNGQNEAEHSTWMQLLTGKTVHRWWSDLILERVNYAMESNSKTNSQTWETYCLHSFGEQLPASWKQRDPNIMSQLRVVVAQLNQSRQERVYLQWTLENLTVANGV